MNLTRICVVAIIFVAISTLSVNGQRLACITCSYSREGETHTGDVECLMNEEGGDDEAAVADVDDGIHDDDDDERDDSDESSATDMDSAVIDGLTQRCSSSRDVCATTMHLTEEHLQIRRGCVRQDHCSTSESLVDGVWTNITHCCERDNCNRQPMSYEAVQYPPQKITALAACLPSPSRPAVYTSPSGNITSPASGVLHAVTGSPGGVDDGYTGYTGYIDNSEYNYPNMVDCEWVIEVPQGQRVRLDLEIHWIEAATSCQFDRLELYDGLDSSLEPFRILCGFSEIHPSLISTTNILRLRFTSDRSATGRGFTASYTAVTDDDVTNMRRSGNPQESILAAEQQAKHAALAHVDALVPELSQFLATITLLTSTLDSTRQLVQLLPHLTGTLSSSASEQLSQVESLLAMSDDGAASLLVQTLNLLIDAQQEMLNQQQQSSWCHQELQSGYNPQVFSHGETCYWAPGDLGTWDEARSSCLLKMMSLVSIVSDDQQEAVDAGLAGREGEGYDSYWLGAVLDSESEQFIWLSHNAPVSSFSYTNWYSRRPAGAECMRSYRGNRWDDDACTSTRRPYVCQTLN